MTKMIHCIKLDREAESLEFQPWPGELGMRILQNVSKDAWQDWLRQQTILINENKLNPLDQDHKKYLATQMEAYFFGDGIVMPAEWQAVKD